MTKEELRQRRLQELRQAIGRARELYRKYVTVALGEGHLSKTTPDHANPSWLKDVIPDDHRGRRL